MDRTGFPIIFLPIFIIIEDDFRTVGPKPLGIEIFDTFLYIYIPASK